MTSCIVLLSIYLLPYNFTPLLLAIREKMAQAYDFALDKIGMEIMSYQVCKSEQCICTNGMSVFFKLLLSVTLSDLGGLHQFPQGSVSDFCFMTLLLLNSLSISLMLKFLFY